MMSARTRNAALSAAAGSPTGRPTGSSGRQKGRTRTPVRVLVALLLMGALLGGVPAGPQPALASDDGAPPLIMPTEVQVVLPQIDWWYYDGEGAEEVNRALRAEALYLVNALADFGHVFGEYTLHLEQDGLISVSMLYSAYREYQAHPTHLMGSVTADVKTGTVYTLADLFVDDRYIGILSEAVARGVVEQDIPTLVDFETIDPDQWFYMTPDALVIYFQVYELAPYAWGFPQFDVPYEELLPIAKPDGPIARVAGTRSR